MFGLGTVLPVVGGAFGFMLGGFGGGIKGAVLGNAIGSLFGKKQKAQNNFGFGDSAREGSRLETLKVQISSYGEVIPKVYGCMRLAGNIIWAIDIKEKEVKDLEEYGEDFREVINYAYSATLAIAICEGEIEEIIRIWADGKLLTQELLRSNSGKFNVYLGSENQLSDSIIGKYKPVGTYPAYRGLCYVVFEDLPLEMFGNHIPNFTFEVRKKALVKPSVEDKIKEVVLIPGAGEFVYGSQIHYKQYRMKVGRKTVDFWGKDYLNMQNYSGKANMLLSLEQMAKLLPNLEWVAVVVCWFASASNAANCRIIPKVEFNNKDTSVLPHDWYVAGISRERAETTLRFDEFTPTYGGTPSDHTIIEICNSLKERNYKIMLYPMIFVDEIQPNPKPWRGRIKANSSNDIITWFNKSQGYNNFILHYANLTNGKIDAFIIGSELIGLTSFTEQVGSYPAVDQLVNLASLVKNKLGASTLVTYAADWSEYHHTEGGWFNLDPLWASEAIDFVGIDAYFPLTEDLPQKQITEDLIKQGWQSGEGWEYYYNHDRTEKHPFYDAKYAWKNIEYWWSNRHQNPGGNYTAWQPKLKPIWFTEFGFPSVDACSNQPNVFYDPSSSESYFPRNSNGKASFYAQRQALNATLDYLQNKNEQENNLIPKRFVWCYDARPFPFFPDLKNIWQDGDLWQTGHWINGKLGNSNLAAIVADILDTVGLKPSDYDVSRLTDIVDGYIISEHLTAREAIEQLQSAYFFDCVESDGILKFLHRLDSSQAIEISESDLVPSNNKNIKETLEITLAQELELPQKVSVSHIDRCQNYETLTVQTQRPIVSTRDQINFSLPIVLDNATAKQIADITLYNSWQERINYKLTLPPKYAYLEPTDIINVKCNNANYSMRIIKLDMQRTGQMKLLATNSNLQIYDFPSQVNYLSSRLEVPKLLASTVIEIMDLPLANNNEPNQGFISFAVNSDDTNWSGATIYYATESQSYKPLSVCNSQATIGVVLNKVLYASPLLFDESSEIIVQLLHGTLTSVGELALLNGANKVLIGDELIQFQNAELIDDKKYKLTKLLRGRNGTEYRVARHKIGDKFILLDEKIVNVPIPNNLIGKEINYKAVTIGKTLAEAENINFIYSGKALKPLSPVHVKAEKDEIGNINISWIRRSRTDSNWRDYVDVAIGEESEKYEEKYKNEPSRIEQQLEREQFVIPEDQTFYDIVAQREKSNIGELINDALIKIEKRNLAKLYGVFRNIDFNSDSNLGKLRERNRRLKMLLEDFNKPALDLSPERVSEDIIGECYIYLISRFASDAGKKAGEFYTPAAVSTLLAKLAAPKSGNIICDPACGSGSLLIKAAKEVGDDNYALYGQEMNNATWALAQMNMFLHSKAGAHIYWGDTLNHPAIFEKDELMKFDIVVANPPFSLDKWGHENAVNDEHKRFWRGIPPKTKGDYAFISHMIETTKPCSGRAAIVVPHGVLFRGGTEGLIRRRLIEENLLDAVIGLPANLFTSTSIPVAILVFDRSREEKGENERRKDVLFIDASGFFKASKGQNFLEDEHINKIVDTYKNRKTIEKYSHLASIEEIRENKHNLNIPRYIDTYEEEEEIDIAELQKEIHQLEKELVNVRSQMDMDLKELGVDV